MAKLVPLDEAAQLLGMTAEQLTELRSRNEIFGYRDGASWKFKMEEIQRVADDKGIELGGGGFGSGLDSDDSDFELSDDALSLDASSGDLVLDDSSGAGKEKDDDLSFGTSDISLAADSNVLDDAVEGEGSPSDTGKMLEDDLQLSEDDLFSDELSLEDSISFEDSSELSSDFEDSDLVLDDSDSSAEVALEANDSGINLSPTDSGISLEEEPLELGGSDIDSLELPEDDEMITLEEAADADAPTQLGADTDFNLTPLEDPAEEASSGSQVIALEDSEIYTDDSAATVLSDSDIVAQPALMPDDGSMQGYDPAMYGGSAAASLPEAPYTIWQILSLGAALILVMLCAMISFDLARHVWQAPTETASSSTLIDFFLSLTGWKTD